MPLSREKDKAIYFKIYYSTTETTDLESRCAKRCLVTDDNTCNYYTVNGGYCQLARYTYSSSSYYKGEIGSLTEYQLKKSINLESMMQSLLGSSNRNCRGIGFHKLTSHGQKVSFKNKDWIRFIILIS